MEEFEIEIDDELAELIRYWAEKEGRTVDEQASVMIREVLANMATSGEPIPPPGESPTAS